LRVFYFAGRKLEPVGTNSQWLFVFSLLAALPFSVGKCSAGG